MNELLQKYFDRIEPIYSFKNVDLDIFFQKEILKKINELDLGEELLNKFAEEIKLFDPNLKKPVFNKINTMRHFVFFLSELDKELKDYAGLINILDIICLKILEKSNPGILEVIVQNSDIFIEQNILPTLNRRFAYQDYDITFKNKTEKLNLFVEKFSIDKDSLSIIKFMFPNLDEKKSQTKSNIVEEIIEKNKIAHPILFNSYFATYKVSDAEKYVLDISKRTKFITSLNVASIDVHKLLEELEKFIILEDNYVDVRRQILMYFRKIIQRDKILVVQNLLILLSYFAKKLSSIHSSLWLSDKFNSAASILDYTKREDSNINFLLNIISDINNSDEFSTAIILFLFQEKDYREFSIKISPIKEKIFESFQIRILKKIEIYKSLFNESGFDDKFEVMFRWKQIERYFKEKNGKMLLPNIENYLYEEFKLNPNSLIKFLSFFIYIDLPKPVIDEQLKSAYELISKTKIIELVNYYKDSSIFDSFDISVQKFLKDLYKSIWKPPLQSS